MNCCKWRLASCTIPAASIWAELLEEINQGLKEVEEDGTYKTIYEKWFKLEPPKAQEVYAVLDVAILMTVILFFRHDGLAGLMMLPYLAWTLFATLLTYGFWGLNR